MYKRQDILIRENFDGMHLKKGTVEKIVELYGYKRVEHVLANTVQERRCLLYTSRSEYESYQNVATFCSAGPAGCTFTAVRMGPTPL